jgi:uncharacterized protein (TIGR00725 family)
VIATRRPVIGVMGAGREGHRALARPVGVLVAELGFHLLTGGGPGVMAEVSRAFVETPRRDGLAIGVLPGGAASKPGYPNPYVELAIRTHLPLTGEEGTRPESRNHVNVLSADRVVALPGGAGTRSEVVLALRYGRPLRLFGPAEAFEGYPEAAVRVSDLSVLRRWLVDTTIGD